MVAIPEATPVTEPETFTDATEVLEEDHVPPVVASLKLVLPPTQSTAVPVIAAGVEGTVFTVTADAAIAVPHAFATV